GPPGASSAQADDAGFSGQAPELSTPSPQPDDGGPETQPPEPPPPSPAYVRQLEERIGFLESRLAEAERKSEQTLAAARSREQELERTKERLERDREKRLFQEKSRAFSRLLEPLDNLERCLAAASLAGDVRAMLDGVALVQKGIQDALASVGLQRFDPTGEPFDPAAHEAIGVVPVGEPDQGERVHATYLAGYRLDDQVIRHARVLVARPQQTSQN
ncbi:MAG: nucleotide exchange factor GrpE, partial [Deltaproteobacteria bacterium]|nr:nucleotide exchange factor GrpE [Deltaproteobacteria bacterium]